MDYISFQKNIYEQWKKLGFYKTKNNPNKPFCLTLPPPNVTGKLHLGHAWDATIQDIVIRSKKLQSYDTFFLCGTDHAGIATQSKAETEFEKKFHITRNSQNLDKIKSFTLDWVKDNCENIHDQWQNLGLIVDWNNEVFTLDNHFSKVVKNVFLKMYKDGLIVREGKMISWDCKLQTAISDIEVIYEDAISELYYVKYYLQDSQEFISVATSRPETIFCDVALIVHPNDKRYIKYHNLKVINPLTLKIIPILLSDKIELEFGTGVMKLTPGHDFHDYEINKKYNFNIDMCINKDGKLNSLANEFVGLDRIAARKLIIEKLIKTHNFIKTEKYHNRIAKSQRSNTIVEPFYSIQWFLKTKNLAKKVLEIQKSKNKVQFIPKRFEKIFNHWLNNIEDWCISRQLWWGHSIPIMHNIMTKETKIFNII